jgi:hypothetical protein
MTESLFLLLHGLTAALLGNVGGLAAFFTFVTQLASAPTAIAHLRGLLYFVFDLFNYIPIIHPKPAFVNTRPAAAPYL